MGRDFPELPSPPLPPRPPVTAPSSWLLKCCCPHKPQSEHPLWKGPCSRAAAGAQVRVRSAVTQEAINQWWIILLVCLCMIESFFHSFLQKGSPGSATLRLCTGCKVTNSPCLSGTVPVLALNHQRLRKPLCGQQAGTTGQLTRSCICLADRCVSVRHRLVPPPESFP